VLREYINFPKFQLPSELLFTTATQITPIVFAFLFTTAVVGHFALALRLVKVPLIILSNAINNVFKNEAIDRYRDKGNCKDLFISLFKKLFLIAIVPFTILFFAAPDLFSLVLGESWRNAGNYAQILIFGLLFELLAFPFRSIFQITNTQFIYLRLQFLSLLLILVAVGLGYYLYNDPWFAVLFYSVAIAISHLVSIVCIYFLAKGNYAKIRIDNA
jgi:O-antigen/teichoic acid export membrane protein